ncbi:MAG: hypothetical protein RIQ93_2897 [Verrucomicrobiota bacterium]|jgi:hypothetical protein
MRSFGLTPDAVLAREAAPRSLPAMSPSFALVYGGLSFGLVSVLAYSIWAFRLIEHTGVMYAAIATVYIGLTGLALSRLVLGAAKRFPALFAVVFLAYAVAWCVFWFGLKGKHQADLMGSAVGLAAMTWLLHRAFGKNDGFLLSFIALFGLHTAGYYLGEWLYTAVGGSSGRLLWGGAHGLGFGAGLGYILHRCQEPLRNRVALASQGTAG